MKNGSCGQAWEEEAWHNGPNQERIVVSGEIDMCSRKTNNQTKRKDIFKKSMSVVYGVRAGVRAVFNACKHFRVAVCRLRCSRCV